MRWQINATGRTQKIQNTFISIQKSTLIILQANGTAFPGMSSYNSTDGSKSGHTDDEEEIDDDEEKSLTISA